MTDIRLIIADNISALRKNFGLTQAELAEKLNYSDKAVSKWERGESIPDVVVLSSLAELFSVTVDYFLHEHTEKPQACNEITPHKRRIRFSVFLTSCISTYVAALILYAVFYEMYSANWLWKLFIAPLPVISVISIVFCAMWFNNKFTLLASVSALLWSSILTAYLFVYNFSAAWLLFIIGIPLQLIIISWLFVVKKKK